MSSNYELQKTLQAMNPTYTAPVIPTAYNVTTKSNEFWELLETRELVSTFRGKVPGGWLVYQTLRAPIDRDKSSIGPMTFIADPQHAWQIRSEFK